VKIAIVVQRYGLEVQGGAELHARRVGEHLTKYHHIEIITTTALDYLTWKPYYKEGEDILHGITIHRFDVVRPRNMFTFDLLNKFVSHFPHPVFAERIWMNAQGPYCPKLLNFIRESKDDYDLFIFLTYMYYPTFFGLPIVSERAVLIPTAHNDPILKFNIFRDFFKRPAGFIYNTIEEKELLENRFGTAEKPGIVAGIGIDIPENLDTAAAYNEYPNLKDREYILYVGRISAPKGAFLLIDHFLRFRKETGRDIHLVIAGKKDLEAPKDPSIIMTGFVSEEVKFSLLKHTRILINPSRFESLSIILLESWLMETPVIVNGECRVLESQVKRSGGGLVFRNYESFKKGLCELLDEREKAHNIAMSGKRYAIDNYSWDIIEKKISDFLESLAHRRPINTS